MRRFHRFRLGRPDTIRVRLALALALALLPVLVLSSLQSVLAFQRQTQVDRADLTAAAERSAAVAQARIESAEVLLQTLAPGSVGFQCAQRLAEVVGRIPGYQNLIRFGPDGGVECAAAAVPSDPARFGRPWLSSLRAGAPVVLTSSPGAAYAPTPSLFAAVRAEGDDGAFDGAMVAVMSLESLRPRATDPLLPPGSEVALADPRGRWLSSTNAAQFPTSIEGRFSGPGGAASQLWLQVDRNGKTRLYSAEPLVGDDVFVVISAPDRELLSWAWLNPVSALALPLLAFVLALIAVLVAAERGVVRWIAYLQRIAAIYARGRFSVRPLQAERAPPEIRDLAETLDAMAAGIVARDAALTENLAQKDQLLLEIHHRVKNNLQIISSLLNMQQRAVSDPAAKAAIADTRERIAALALVYRTLYQGPDLRRIDLRQFLEELVGQLVTGDTGQRLLTRTDFVCDPVVVDPDRLAPIALFAVEAISNARKHGLCDGGQLSVAFRVRGARAELTISDTGGGGVAKVGVGVGRTLMTAFARQLRGDATFKANPTGGLTARLTFALPSCESAAPGATSEVNRAAAR
ncbi:MAG TPA: sensor histidine kinase [Caulobacteraceae bacterium]|nr:sensor histidine kinase [Caulobacteraceae bacterium]